MSSTEVIAQIENRELTRLADFAAEATRSGGQDASFLIEQHALADVDALWMLAARLERARVAAAKSAYAIGSQHSPALSQIGQSQRMVDQAAVEHAATPQRHSGSVVCRSSRPAPVCCTSLQLWHPLDLHLAQAATAVDAELGMVAVVRDVEPRGSSIRTCNRGIPLVASGARPVDRDFHEWVRAERWASPR